MTELKSVVCCLCREWYYYYLYSFLFVFLFLGKMMILGVADGYHYGFIVAVDDAVAWVAVFYCLLLYYHIIFHLFIVFSRFSQVFY